VLAEIGEQPRRYRQIHDPDHEPVRLELRAAERALIETPMITNNGSTSMAVSDRARHGHRSVPQKSEKMKYTKNGLDGSERQLLKD